MTLVLGALILIGAVYAIARQAEVRLVLLIAALAMALVAGIGRAFDGGGWTELSSAPMPILKVFVGTFSNEKFVVPICCAMGFAFALRETGCDQHLVRLLTKPFERVRPLLVPGAVVVGFLVNVPLVSQTSTAVAVGTVMVPLLRASRISSLTIGSAIILGASIGGELLNPAAPELRSVAEALRQDKYPDATAQNCVSKVAPLVWPALIVSTLVFWLQSWWLDRLQPDVIAVDAETASPTFRVKLIKALVPFIPLIVLFLTSSTLNIISIPKHWLCDLDPTTKKLKEDAFDSRLIGVSMLIGVLAAALTAPKTFKNTARTFFEGAGYGFTYIIGLIVAASCFGEGIKQIGLNVLIGRLIESNPGLLIPLAALLPLGFGALSGSGMAATQSLFEFFVGPINSSGADPFHVGATVSLGAAAGRTLSPVSAVTLMTSRMTECNPFALAQRVAIPVLAGLLTVIVLAMIRN